MTSTAAIFGPSYAPTALRLTIRAPNWSAIAFMGAATLVALSWMSATLTTVGTVGNMITSVRSVDAGLAPRPLRSTLPPPKRLSKFERVPSVPDAAGLDAGAVRLAFSKASTASLAAAMREAVEGYAADLGPRLAPLTYRFVAAAADLKSTPFADYAGLTADLRAAVAHDDLAEPTDLVVPVPRLRPEPPVAVAVVKPTVAPPPAVAAPAPDKRQTKPAAVAPAPKVAALPPVTKAPPLAVPGTRNGVAVYDISAGVVYLPNGERLEAHSGIGHMRDNPRFTHVKMRGATPPGTYNLRMREALFHGVEAIRLNPADGVAPKGRTGLLAHTYMLRVPGDSNGCVVFRDYRRFLAAFKRGEIRQMVVVNSAKTRVASN